MESWGFRYVSNIIWAKRRKDGGRTVAAWASTSATSPKCSSSACAAACAPSNRALAGNMIETRKREHSRKPDEQYELIESCSPGPYLELFARRPRPGWTVWGDEADEAVVPRGKCIVAMPAARSRFPNSNCICVSTIGRHLSRRRTAAGATSPGGRSGTFQMKQAIRSAARPNFCNAPTHRYGHGDTPPHQHSEIERPPDHALSAAE